MKITATDIRNLFAEEIREHIQFSLIEENEENEKEIGYENRTYNVFVEHMKHPDILGIHIHLAGDIDTESFDNDIESNRIPLKN